MKELYKQIRYITGSKFRISEFKKLVKNKNLKTSDIILVLTTVGLNVDFYQYYPTPTERQEGVRHKNYLYSENVLIELCDEEF